MNEQVVLLDPKTLEPLGTADKATVHQAETPLHLAFSCFVFNSKGELLTQRRALHKKTWPGVWANSCCGHPAPGELVKEAVQRRLQFELGYSLGAFELFEVLPDFKYRASHDGIEENEFCPVWVGFTDEDPKPNSEEIAEIKWIDWIEFVAGLPDLENFAIWCKEEAKLMMASEYFKKLWQENVQNNS